MSFNVQIKLQTVGLDTLDKSVLTVQNASAIAILVRCGLVPTSTLIKQTTSDKDMQQHA
jgi:hypothetical protein